MVFFMAGRSIFKKYTIIPHSTLNIEACHVRGDVGEDRSEKHRILLQVASCAA